MIKTKIKKPFAERWISQLSKNFNSIIALLSNSFAKKEDLISSIHQNREELKDSVMETYDYLFSIATLLKIKPKALAKTLSSINKDGNKLSVDFSRQLAQAQIELFESSLDEEPKQKDKKTSKVKNKAKNKVKPKTKSKKK